MRYLFLAAALAGCAEKAIDLRFDVSEGAANLDVSCVNSVQVLLHDGSFDVFGLPSACIEVSNPTSLQDIEDQIRGKLAMDLPDDMIAIEIRGLAGATSEFCGSGTNVFYAGAEFAGQPEVRLRAEGSLSCQAIQTQNERKLHAIDFLALVDTPDDAAPVCQTPTNVIDLAMGTIRPTNIDLPEFATAIVDTGTGATIDANGIAFLPAYGEAEPTSCLAAASFHVFSASCLYPGTPSLCGADEVVVPVISDVASFESIDDEVFGDYPVMVLGQVWDTVTKKPVEGATIAFADPSRGQIVYAERGSNSRLDPKLGATGTTAKGLFIAYMREPSVVQVMQGTSKKVMRLGGATGWGSAVIVPLR